MQLASLRCSYCSVQSAEYDALSCVRHSRRQKANGFKQTGILRLQPIKEQSRFERKCEVALVSMPTAYAFESFSEPNKSALTQLGPRPDVSTLPHRNVHRSLVRVVR